MKSSRNPGQDALTVEGCRESRINDGFGDYFDSAPQRIVNVPLGQKQTLNSTQICVLGHMIRERNGVQLASKARSSYALINIQTKLGATGRDSRCNSLAGKDSEC